MSKKITKKVGKVFCLKNKSAVRVDFVQRHACADYRPIEGNGIRWCGFCYHHQNLDMNGNYTDRQKAIMNPELPEFVKGDC